MTNVQNEVAVNVFAVALESRIAYETSKATMSESNMKKLATAHKRASHASIVALLSAASVDAECVNVSTNSNSRVDIYEVEKIYNAVSSAARVDVLNEYSRCILLTAKRCFDASTDMLLEDARVACSAHLKSADKTRKALIVQHKETKSDSTVNAQHRSSLAALIALNVITDTSVSRKQRTFKLNAENAITVKLLERCAA